MVGHLDRLGRITGDPFNGVRIAENLPGVQVFASLRASREG
jgi:hypothetical protein